ncbi:oxygenase MpaB family protein [Conexibacter sp. SYSU D00693]|uniref:oxygenase MpaB family protein n=1 Tax=Conexibacter sp. SYSU D00693 TaxID=2812560 RepID=UPI00196AD280|nr:oxygenase MpaB family protein [Conexibacter sp. SYSU D00693]
MRERAVNLLYGQRALVIGALQPVAFIGTGQRSKAHATPWKRLVHTAEMFDAVFFGSKQEADRALAFTRRLHERVNGTIDVQAGPYGPSTPYDALDSQLMLWVTAPLYDSARVLHDTFVRPLDAEEDEALYQDFCTWGELFGMDRDVLPPTATEFRAWWPEQLTGDGVHLTEEARTVGLNIMLRMPSPRALRPAMRTAGFLVQGSLPPVVREHYRLRWSLADETAYRATARAARLGRPVTPRRLRRGSSAEAYALLRRSERQDLRKGRASFQGIGR